MIGSPISLDQIKGFLNHSSKDKIPGPDGWTIENFISLFVLMGHDICKVVEKWMGKVSKP